MALWRNGELMNFHFSAHYLPWANGESGEVVVTLNGLSVFSLPVQFDAGPKEPQVEQALRDFIQKVAQDHGALKW